MCMTRLVVDSGGRITGGAAQVGSVGVDRRQALLDHLARLDQVGAALEDELDRRELRDRRRADLVEPRTPLSACSSGTVTSSSVSAVESPRQMVWTSTRGGANSGKASIARVPQLARRRRASSPRRPRPRGSGTSGSWR